MKLDIRHFFTMAAVAASLERLQPLSSPVIDFLFPQNRRVNHPFPTIGRDDLGLPATNVAVVRRGSQSLALNTGDTKINLIEPQPVSVNTFLGAAEINNMLQLTAQGQQQLIDNKINFLRESCRQTAEALAAQALTGKISYPMKSDGANLNYEVDYGTPAAVTVTKKWNDNATKISDIIKSFGEITESMKKKGYGSNVAFLCGLDVYSALVEKIGGLNNSAVGTVSIDGVNIGGIKISYLAASYVDLNSGNMVSGIPAKTVIAIDMNANHRLFYAALDDLDANLVPMPFFAKPIDLRDPSGWKIVGESKPLPVVNTKAMVKATVLD